jgi:putative ABC transport system substrate-binding protein
MTPPGVRFLREGLHELGYVEGKTVALETRFGMGKPDALDGLAAGFVHLGVDALVALGPGAIVAAKRATTTLPLIGADLESDPVESGFIASLARPGGNLTGVFLDLPELTVKWLELAREVKPGARRIAALWDANTGVHQVRAITRAANAMSFDLRVLEFRRAADVERVLNEGVSHGPEILIQLSSPLINQLAVSISKFSAAHRLVSISMFRPFPEAGGLISYGPNLSILFRRLASYVEKILKGARPGELPVERPTNFELIVNLKTARALGLKLPQSVLVRADEAIE